MPLNRTSKIAELKREIAALEPVKCGMRHERIARMSPSIIPIACANADHGFARETYCDLNKRSMRIGCAHTNARLRLFDIVETLRNDNTITREIADSLTERIDKIDLSICMVDRSKSDEELTHAHISVRISDHPNDKLAQKELASCNDRITALVDEHNRLIDELAEIRSELLSLLDTAEEE